MIKTREAKISRIKNHIYPIFAVLLAGGSFNPCLQASEQEFLQWESIKINFVETKEIGAVKLSAHVNDDGIQSFKVAAFGKKYNLKPRELNRIKRNIKYLKSIGEANSLTWQSIAARPATATAFCERVEAAFIEMIKTDSDQ